MSDDRDYDELTREEKRSLKSAKHEGALFNFGYKIGRWVKSRERDSTPQKAAPKSSAPARPLERTKNETVYFGSFPQTIKPRNVSIENSLGDGLYRGSDGEIYYKKEYDKNKKRYNSGMFNFAACNSNVAFTSRYSDGQNSQDVEYFRVEPIKWYIIHRENGILTLMSDKILFNSFYSVIRSTFLNVLMSYQKSTWAASDIRKKLNGEFYETAFSSEERASIVPTSLQPENEFLKIMNKQYLDSATTDNVFMLSVAECKRFGLNRKDLAKRQTDFCGKNLSYGDGSWREDYSTWFTRTICGAPSRMREGGDVDNPDTVVIARYVNGSGNIIETYFNNPVGDGIAPVIRVRESDVYDFDDEEEYDDENEVEYAEAATETQPEESGKKEPYMVGGYDISEYLDTDTTGGNSSAPQSKPSPKQNPEPISLGQRILYTILAPVAFFVGGFLALIVLNGRGGGTGNLGGFCMIGYLVFSEVMVWKIKQKLWLMRLLALLNVVVSFITWLIAGLI